VCVRHAQYGCVVNLAAPPEEDVGSVEREEEADEEDPTKYWEIFVAIFNSKNNE
jgi:hypothetical protein